MSRGNALSKKNRYKTFTGRQKTPQELRKVSEAYYYDIIISSGEAKKLILKRIKQLNVDLRLVLREAGISEAAFKTKYLRDSDPVSSPKFRQSHFIRLFEVLGIKVRVQFVVEKDINKIRTEHLRYNK